MNNLLARIVYVILACSIFLISTLALFYFFLHPERYLTWWALLLSGPIFMSCLLIISLVVNWFGQFGDNTSTSSTLKRMCSWYYDACQDIQLERSIAYMCAWLSHLHFVTGAVTAIICFIAYLAGLKGPYLNISGLLLIYLFIIVLFSSIRRNCAPEPGLDYRE